MWGLWLIVALVAVIVGIDKSLIPGSGTLAVGILANVIPARQASGLSLALIIVGDWCAIWAFRKNVEWGILRKLMPNVVVGIALGAVFLALADDTMTKRTIGVILFVFIVWNLIAMALKRRRAALRIESLQGDRPPAFVVHGASSARPVVRRRFRPRGLFFGGLAGFTTMVANAGGPVTTMYFLAEGLGVMTFIGTTAWFFLIINLIKLPISLGLGMLTVDMLPMVAAMAPLILVVTLIGRWLAKRINPRVFKIVIVALTFVASVNLIIN